MIYIEDLISYISNPVNRVPYNQMLKKDIGLIMNISNQLKNNISLTNGQADLLVKVLKENLSIFSNIPNIDLMLTDPKFKFSFRKLDTSRKISLLTIEDKQYIAIKFPFNNKINNILYSITNKCQFDKLKKVYLMPLTTKNVHDVVDKLKEHGFNEVDETVSNWYNQMKVIYQEPESYTPTIDINGLHNVNQFTTSYFNSQKKDTLISNMFLARTLKINLAESIKDELKKLNLSPMTDLILNSSKNKIKINSNTTNISAIAGAIKDIEAYPITIILNDDQHVNQNLENWFIDLSNTGITSKEISVLFRSASNKDVNTFIKNNSLNNIVSEETKVVFIKQKVPKILFKIGFKPKLIISTSGLYAHYTAQKMVDTHPFVIYYTNQVAILEDNHID